MAKFIEEKKPTEATFIFEFTQTEVDILTGIVNDFLDNPQRRVYMSYEVDGDTVKPSPHGMSRLQNIATAMNEVMQGENYDYFDYWETV